MMGRSTEPPQLQYERTLSKASEEVAERTRTSPLVQSLISQGNYQGALDLLQIYRKHEKTQADPSPDSPSPSLTNSEEKIESKQVQKHQANQSQLLPTDSTIKTDSEPGHVITGPFIIAPVPGGFQIFAQYNRQVQPILYQPLKTIEQAQRVISSRFVNCPVKTFQKRIKFAYQNSTPPAKIPHALLTATPEVDSDYSDYSRFQPQSYQGYRIESYKKKKRPFQFRVCLQVGSQSLPVAQGFPSPGSAIAAIDNQFKGVAHVEWSKVRGHAKFDAKRYNPDPRCPYQLEDYQITHTPLEGYHIETVTGEVVSDKTYARFEIAKSVIENQFQSEPIASIHWDRVTHIPLSTQKLLDKIRTSPGNLKNRKYKFRYEIYDGYEICWSQNQQFSVALSVGGKLLDIAGGFATEEACKSAIDQQFESCPHAKWERVRGHREFRPDLYEEDDRCPRSIEGYQIVQILEKGYTVQTESHEQVCQHFFTSFESAQESIESQFELEPFESIRWEFVHCISVKIQKRIERERKAKERSDAKQAAVAEKSVQLRTVKFIDFYDDSEYFTQSKLIERGWTKAGIDQFLFPPDAKRKNYLYKNGAPFLLYKQERVLKIEQSEAFQEWQEKSKKRKAAAQKATETRYQKMEEYLTGLTFEVPKVDRKKLIRQACDHYNDRKEEWASERWTDSKRAQWTKATPSSSPDFLERIMVNYLRHQLSRYEEEMEKVLGKTGAELGRTAIREKIYEAIAVTYPDLAEECESQRFDRLIAQLDENLY